MRTAGATQRVSGGHAWPCSRRQRHLNGLPCPKLTRHPGYPWTVECTEAGRVRSSPDHDGTICTKAPAGPLSSRQRLLPVIAFPLCGVFPFVVGLVGQMNRQTPVVQGEVQVKMTPTSFNSHPPLVMTHLLQVDRSAGGDNLIKCRSPILQPPLKSDLDGTAVGLPDQVVLFRFAHLWMIARHRIQRRQPSRHLRS